MGNTKRLQELVEKGKKKPLNSQELMEMISLLGPEASLNAIRQNGK